MRQNSDEPVEKKAQNYFLYDGVLSAVMVALTSSMISLFALSMGASNIEIGMLSSIPMIFWTMAQIPGAILSERIGKEKAMAGTSALLSRLMWIPIILLPVFGDNIGILVVLVTLSTFIGALGGPSWASFSSHLIPVGIRGRFFSRKNRIAILCSVIAMISAAIYLDMNPQAISFSLVFLIGIVIGLIATFLFFMRIPYQDTQKKQSSSIVDDVKLLFMNKNFRTFLIIFFIMRFGVELASSYFVVDMVKNMNATYIWITVTTAVSAVTSALIQKKWGRISDWFGQRIIIITCTFGISIIALGWVFASSPVHVLVINIMSGISWAGFELAFFNYLLEVSPPDKRAKFAAIVWTIMGIAAITAPIIGGLILEKTANITILGLYNFKFLFLLSFIIRLLAAILFLRYLKEIINYREKTSFKYVIRYITHIRLPGIHMEHILPIDKYIKRKKRK